MEDCDYDVIGIDLGTTNSCVAVWKNGQIAIVPNEMGNRTTPSVISFLDTETLIGYTAFKKLKGNYQNTIFDCKRLIGHKVSDVEIQEDMRIWPFQVIADENDNPLFHLEKSKDGKFDYSPEEISGMLLKYLKEQADNYVGHPVNDAVITVPAYFNDSQRKATENAARLAGLNVLRLLDEPSAAALAYNFESGDQTRNILIYDLGGGTFDVSILEVGKQRIRVIASDGDNHLGGEDFDRVLMNYLFFQYERQTNEDISNNRLWRSRMRNAVEACKIELSVSSSSFIEFENSDFSFSVSRLLFENLNSSLFNRTIEVVKNTIEKAHLLKSDIAEVVLVGGSTRIPKIQFLLREFFTDAKICKSINPDEAVAMGAVIMAAVVKSQQLKLLPSKALLSFGIETQGELVEVMIPRDTPLPVTCSYDFITPLDYQKEVRFRIVMGERKLVRDCILLGEIHFSDLPLHHNGETVFSISMSLTQEYHLTVIAIESSGNKRIVWEMNLDKSNPQSPLNLTPYQLQNIIVESESKKLLDDELVGRHQEMNILYNLVEDSYAMLYMNEDHMSDEWILEKREVLDSIKEWIQQNPDAEIREIEQRRQLVLKNILGAKRNSIL